MMKLFRISTIPLSLNILLKGQLHYLNQHFSVTAISGAGPDLETVAEREGVRTLEVEMQRQISPLRDLVSLWRLYRCFSKEKPDMIHSITPKAGLLSMVAGKWAGVPVRMHTFTGLIFPNRTGPVQKILILMDRILCHHATHIYPEGRGVREDLIRYRITDKPLKIVANGNVNGIDTQWFSPAAISEDEKQSLRTGLGISPDDFVFIFVGRLVRDKGINELVNAFKNLNHCHCEECSEAQQRSKLFCAAKALNLNLNLKLLLVGPLEQDLDPLLPETLKEIESNPNIMTVGFQEDVRPYFGISDCLAFPSYREGFPNVVMQAGAMDLPALVSDINGCNEIIIEGENGRIIPVKNAAALQKAMEKMVSDTVGYHTMKENARPMIESRYQQEVVWQALLEEYRRVTE